MADLEASCDFRLLLLPSAEDDSGLGVAEPLVTILLSLSFDRRRGSFLSPMAEEDSTGCDGFAVVHASDLMFVAALEFTVLRKASEMERRRFLRALISLADGRAFRSAAARTSGRRTISIDSLKSTQS